MLKKKKAKKNTTSHSGEENPVSLAPLSAAEALRGLLQVKPKKKTTKKTKKKAATNKKPDK